MKKNSISGSFSTSLNVEFQNVEICNIAKIARGGGVRKVGDDSCHHSFDFSVEKSWAFWGFTLVELLAVIVVVGVLTAFLLSAVQAAQETAKQSPCSGSLKFEIAVRNFPNTADGIIPTCIENREDRRPARSLFLFPYSEQTAKYEALTPKKDKNNPKTAGNALHTFAVPVEKQLFLIPCSISC